MSDAANGSISKYAPAIAELLARGNEVIVGKDYEMRTILCCLLAGGHLLIEDLPGMGKTTLVKALAKLLGLEFSRIQFTSDLLPADILGVSVFEDKQKAFVFRRGPIFAQLVLGDELNRASPKTQSACLQAMEESEVTVDNITHALPAPFFFIATQNPRQSFGTFPLPASQLDRFLMRIELGFPSEEAEKKLLLGKNRMHMIDELKPVLGATDVREIQAMVENIHISESLAEYVVALVRRSRVTGLGLSPRAGIDLLAAARSWAFLEGRSYVIPEDIQAVALPVMNHRLGQEEDGRKGRELALQLVQGVPLH